MSHVPAKKESKGQSSIVSIYTLFYSCTVVGNIVMTTTAHDCRGFEITYMYA